MFLEFFCIQLLLFLICTYCGYKYRKKGHKNIYFWLIVLGFTLIEGLRFGRGIDYNVYHNVFVLHQIGSYENGKAILFDSLCELLVILNLPYQSMILICSGILSFSIMSWLKHYPLVLMSSLLWFCSSYLITTENLFRWYTAFSFVLLGLHELINCNTKKYILFSSIGAGFHIMMIFPIILFYLLNKLKSNIVNPWIALLLYIVLSIVWSSDFMLKFIPFANFIITQVDSYQSYGDNLSQWLTGTYHDDVEKLSMIRQILNFIFYAYLLVVGRKIVDKNKKLLLYYNILIIGIISYPAMRVIELADRFNQLLMFFQCIIGAYCLFYTFKDVYLRKKYLFFSIFIISILAQKTYTYLTPNNKYYTLYIWNSGNIESLPIEYLDHY